VAYQRARLRGSSDLVRIGGLPDPIAAATQQRCDGSRKGDRPQLTGPRRRHPTIIPNSKRSADQRWALKEITCWMPLGRFV
jgi:hypothetical protein